MGFAITGHPSMESELTEDRIRLNLNVYTSSWLNGLNYSNYKDNVFKIDLRLFKSEITDFNYNSDDSIVKEAKFKNDYIIWELKTLEGLIQWIESVFTFYGFEKFNISEYQNQYENEKDVSKLHDLLNNEKNSILQQACLINDLFTSNVTTTSDDYFLLYVSVLLYIDYNKIHEFLKSEYKVGLPLENRKSNKKNNSFSFKDFFKKDDRINLKKILKIKEKYKEYDGKELAILIYLLDKKFQILDTDTSGRTKIGFVRALKDLGMKDLKEINSVTNQFKGGTGELIYFNETNSSVMKTFAELEKIIY